MSMRDVSGFTLVVAVLVFLGVVGWQTWTNNARIENLTKSVSHVSDEIKGCADKKELEGLWARLDEGFKLCANKTEIQVLSAKVASVEGGLRSDERGQTVPALPSAPPPSASAGAPPVTISGGGATAMVDQNAPLAKRLKDIERRLNELDDARVEHAAMYEELARRVTGHEVKGNMEQLVKPADPIGQHEGKLWIRNEMDSVQHVAVNGTALYTIESRKTLPITVHVETATTQIAGESPMSWSIGAPNYEQEIVIAPASRNPLNMRAP